MTRRALAWAFLLCAGLVQADIRPFVPGSLPAIEAAQLGRAFILTFWSADCTHCPSELKALGDLKRLHPKLEVVIVATDTPAAQAELQRLALGYGLGTSSQWVFADTQPERLRYEIDRRWYGELPRSYFYDRQHRRTARSGVIPFEQLERWVGEQVK